MALTTKYPGGPVRSAREVRTGALTVIAFGVIIAILYFGRVFFITSITAVILAFILEPFVTLLMRLRFPRPLASFVVCVLALLFLYVVGMGAYTQLAVFSQDLPKYGERIGEMVDGVRQRINDAEERTYKLIAPARQRKLEEERLKEQQAAEARSARSRRGAPAPQPAAPPALPEESQRSPLSDYVYEHLSSVYEIILMASFVPFLVYFMLSWRDHINRSFLQFFSGEDRLIAARSMAGIAEMVRAYVVGNFLLGLLLALISSVAFWYIGLPYPLLVGPLSGFLSLVPYVGLPLAMIPPLFAALGLNLAPVYILVVVITSLLHLIALNLLYPKIVGTRVHLNPVVVTFSLMLWGFLWSAAGLVLAVPLTAGVKAVCDNVKDLRRFGKFLGD